jgi:iron complex outermembrane receptor protein
VTLTGGLDNILNRYYWEACSYQRDPFRSGLQVPEPGRSAYLNAAYNF